MPILCLNMFKWKDFLIKNHMSRYVYLCTFQINKAGTRIWVVRSCRKQAIIVSIRWQYFFSAILFCCEVYRHDLKCSMLLAARLGKEGSNISMKLSKIYSMYIKFINKGIKLCISCEVINENYIITIIRNGNMLTRPQYIRVHLMKGLNSTISRRMK